MHLVHGTMACRSQTPVSGGMYNSMYTEQHVQGRALVCVLFC